MRMAIAFHPIDPALAAADTNLFRGKVQLFAYHYTWVNMIAIRGIASARHPRDVSQDFQVTKVAVYRVIRLEACLSRYCPNRRETHSSFVVHMVGKNHKHQLFAGASGTKRAQSLSHQFRAHLPLPPL
jgi:hypothetical protein